MNTYDSKKVESNLMATIEKFVDELFSQVQNEYGIDNGEAHFEQVFALDDAKEKLARAMREILDVQYRLTNSKNKYKISFTKEIEARNVDDAIDEAIEILKGKIDSVNDIADLLRVEKIEED